MVFICDKPFENDSKFLDHFQVFPFPLSDFQKYSIEAIVEGHHALVCAPTGSGKTLPAEFAIQFFKNKGKKVVYTSPIKALSNQKYYEFTQKYPHISFGLFTGDIKTNPDADVLIMTTEILMNYLFTLNNHATSHETNLQFQLNIQTDLGCVIFDEVHYINDADRGKNWEQTILMLPHHIQMVMLSATIDSPAKFAEWCERGSTEKQVYLAYTNKRIVPLTHYGFLTTNEIIFKKIKNKDIQNQIRNATNKFIPIQTEHGVFQDSGYLELKKTKKLFEENQVFMKRTHVLNSLALQLRDKDMLPAIAFVFSRKHVEQCAKEITVVLLEDDSKIPYTIRRECEQIIRKLPNYQEYLELPEYNELVSLLEKGIGIHHSGMIPILREIVEYMISKKYIKLLFATESFAIGLDCPIRTAIFTSLTKFDGSNQRFLLPHEYTQMAGRAGRRGIDTIGNVIHCNNIFELETITDYKGILCGKPQTLISKFHISFSVILNLMRNGQCKKVDFYNFVKKSMIQNELHQSIQSHQSNLEKIKLDLIQKEKFIQGLRTPIHICEEYLKCKELLPSYINKKRKDAERSIQGILDGHKNCIPDSEHIKSVNNMKSEIHNIQCEISYLDHYIESRVDKICDILEKRDFITKLVEDTDKNEYSFTNMGKIASGIAEIHPLIFSECIKNWNHLTTFTPKQLVSMFSCFTDIKVDQELRVSVPVTTDLFLKNRINELSDLYSVYEDIESIMEINSGYKYDGALVYDVIDIFNNWCDCDDEQSCKYFIQTTLSEKSISIGDFTKAILKISTITKELINVCEQNELIEFMYKLSQIDGMILKYIATTQSLYV
jgi:superfamily II RNA helicase